MIDPAVRDLGIGGSEVAAIFGCDEFRDAFDVCASKKGGLPRQEPNMRMVVGKILERGVLDLYTHITGRPHEYCDITSRHPERQWMVYTPDALVPGERRGVDAKVVWWDQRKAWGFEANEVPLRVTFQAAWYMAALDYDAWDICALIGGDPRVYTIERDKEAERVILARAEEWYRRYLLGDERPPLGNSETAAAWLQAAYPRHKRPDMREANEAETDLLNEYLDVRIAQKKLKAQRDKLEIEIKAAIQDREGLTWDEGRFTWRRTRDGKKIRWENMARGLANQFLATEKEREDLIEFYTDITQGYRKIRIDHPSLAGAAEEVGAAA